MRPCLCSLRERRCVAAIVVVGLVSLVVAGALTALYFRGGGPLPERLRFLAPASPALDPGPAEIALRTLRLAGYEHAVVGEEYGIAVVRLSLPSVTSPADVALSWRTALTVAAEAYPGSSTCVAQIFAGRQSLLEAEAPTEAVKDAVERGEDAVLEDAVRLRYLSESGG